MIKSAHRGCCARLALLASLGILSGACQQVGDYFRNGMKVGPRYEKPDAEVAQRWIDADDVRVRSVEADDSEWWGVFKDPILDGLIRDAYAQNLSLREAAFRVLEARAKLGIVTGQFFPQEQELNGGYQRNGLSKEVANRQFIADTYYDQWSFGFNLAWELDLWGRFRRAIAASSAELDASVDAYDDVLVTLLGDVAQNYVQIRIFQQQIAYATENAKVQQQILDVCTARFRGGQASELDVNQSQSDLANTQALIPQLELRLREASNRLCILMGIPPQQLADRLGSGAIPSAPTEVAVGIPADLLRRRPDVRRAERLAAAQSERIGMAIAEVLPAFSLLGTFGWSAENLSDLFTPTAFRGAVGPIFQWDILNYGRHANDIRLQDARFKELVTSYQQTVLTANEEVENGLARFLLSQTRTKFAQESADAEAKALGEAMAQYTNGLVDFNRVAVIQERLVQRQNQFAEAQGEIALGLVDVYRALGGRLGGAPGKGNPNDANDNAASRRG